jgi:hypothetical protein
MEQHGEKKQKIANDAKIPRDAMRIIFSFLDVRTRIGNVYVVCKRWQEISSDPFSWPAKITLERACKFQLTSGCTGMLSTRTRELVLQGIPHEHFHPLSPRDSPCPFGPSWGTFDRRREFVAKCPDIERLTIDFFHTCCNRYADNHGTDELYWQGPEWLKMNVLTVYSDVSGKLPHIRWCPEDPLRTVYIPTCRLFAATHHQQDIVHQMTGTWLFDCTEVLETTNIHLISSANLIGQKLQKLRMTGGSLCCGPCPLEKRQIPVLREFVMTDVNVLVWIHAWT